MDTWCSANETLALLEKTDQTPALHVFVVCCLLLYSLFQVANTVIKNSAQLVVYLKGLKSASNAKTVTLDNDHLDKYKDL